LSYIRVKQNRNFKIHLEIKKVDEIYRWSGLSYNIQFRMQDESRQAHENYKFDSDSVNAMLHYAIFATTCNAISDIKLSYSTKSAVLQILNRYYRNF
jgi:hypothetical protein